MAYSVVYTNAFHKRYKLLVKRGYDMSKLRQAIEILANDGALPQSYRPHKLIGKRIGEWECHIEPDWLLVWEQHDEELVLIFLDTGTHSDIFG